MNWAVILLQVNAALFLWGVTNDRPEPDYISNGFGVQEIRLVEVNDARGK